MQSTSTDTNMLNLGQHFNSQIIIPSSIKMRWGNQPKNTSPPIQTGSRLAGASSLAAASSAQPLEHAEPVSLSCGH